MKLTTTARSHLLSRVFGLPGQRKYPMPDKSHAHNAESRATQQHELGNLSDADYQQIMQKAHSVLGR